MSRHPLKADPIARQRGDVQYYEHGAGMNADVTITTPEIFAPVKIKRMRYLRCTIRRLERERRTWSPGIIQGRKREKKCLPDCCPVVQHKRVRGPGDSIPIIFPADETFQVDNDT